MCQNHDKVGRQDGSDTSLGTQTISRTHMKTAEADILFVLTSTFMLWHTSALDPQIIHTTVMFLEKDNVNHNEALVFLGCDSFVRSHVSP